MFYLSLECFFNSLSNPYTPPWLGKFMAFAFLENALNLGIFTHHPTEGNHSFPLGKLFLKISFPQQQKRMEETMICFIKMQ